MVDNNLEDTQKIKIRRKKSALKRTKPIQREEPQETTVKKPKRWRVVLFGILLLILLGGAGGGGAGGGGGPGGVGGLGGTAPPPG